MDAEIAKALYLGIVHDTGVFQYSNTTPNTLRIAAKLLAYGFDFSKLIDETFFEKTYVQNQVLGRALLESVRFMDGRCIFSSIDLKTMEFYKVVPKDLDGIVSQLRITKGVECAIFCIRRRHSNIKSASARTERWTWRQSRPISGAAAMSGQQDAPCREPCMTASTICRSRLKSS